MEVLKKMSDENQKYKVQNLVGVPTDYSDENNWAHLPENADKAVDTFFHLSDTLL